MNDKVVFYFGAGGMSGVFGAGIGTELEESNIYSKIEAIYGCSAGAFNAAYFLARDSRLGSSIYWENLTDGRFINLRKVLRGNSNAMNIDHLVEVSRSSKVLNLDALRNQSIPFFVKVLNS